MVRIKKLWDYQVGTELAMPPLGVKSLFGGLQPKLPKVVYQHRHEAPSSSRPDATDSASLPRNSLHPVPFLDNMFIRTT